ncbi:hypothetical protein VE00_04284 [Pseudogymnoascus sp. WSF 3629]|nr:hypothetical protein VE00_04284 [Pseudogymnoascus sp. WSF 3629]
MTKLLTVFGATGQQGGSLINYILKRPELSKLYHLRGITRDVSKANAVALKERGVEIVQADLNDPASLVAAVADSYAVFGVWEQASQAIEIAQGKAIADSSVAAGVSLLIWSSLPNITKISEGKLTAVKHFDGKAEVEEYIRTLPILSAFYMPGFYMQNHIAYMRPQPKGDGTYVLSQPLSPTAQIPMIDITDTGKYIAPILLDPAKYNGTRFTYATVFHTPLQLVEGWTKVTGKQVSYSLIDADASVGGFTPEMRAELKKSAGLMDDYSYYGSTGKEDLEWTLAQVKDKLTTWEEFVQANEPWFEGA